MHTDQGDKETLGCYGRDGVLLYRRASGETRAVGSRVSDGSRRVKIVTQLSGKIGITAAGRRTGGRARVPAPAPRPQRDVGDKT